MACFRPVQAFRLADGSVSFAERGPVEGSLQLPCGRCVGCRLARSRAWAIRCVHEASLHERNCFVTLTYDEAHLPPFGSLRYRDFQLFMKRLRREFSPDPVRFFVCGEYGEGLKRPHYHACLFGVDFADKRRLTLAGKDSGFSSSLLERLWGHGHVHLGSLNVRSAGYAARYVLKKVTGAPADEHYAVSDCSGADGSLVPEFCRVSLRPGVGARWFDRYRGDLRGDFVVHEGVRYSVPRYYDKLTKRVDRDRFEAVKEERETRALPFKSEQHPARLAVREVVEEARINQLKRSL